MKHNIIFSTIVLLVVAGSLSYAGEGKAPLTVAGATTIDATQAKKLFDDEAPFIDVRPDKDWDMGRVPDAYHIELKEKLTKESLSEAVKKDEKVVMYCNGVKCMRSSKAVAKAVGWGYTKVLYFRGGYPDWIAAGYPVE